MILAFRKRLLLDEVDAAQEEYQEVAVQEIGGLILSFPDSVSSFVI